MTNQSTAQQLSQVFDDKQAMMLAEIIDREIKEQTARMATKEDLEVLTHKSDVRFAQLMAENAKHMNRLIIWLVGSMFTIAGLVVAILRLF